MRSRSWDRISPEVHFSDQNDSPAQASFGDDSVTARLYQSYASRLLAYLYVRMASSASDVEDQLFDIFLVVFEHEQELVAMQEDEQRAWLWTVARNKVIDHHRHTQRHPHVPLEQIVEVIDNAATPEQAALQQEEYQRLQAHLRTLPPNQQEVLQLRFSAGLRCAEIARVLQKREGAVRTLLSRTLRALRKSYSG